ncbi:MAG: hypothetical protein ACRDJH_15225 [Thermomicrobiales bacterium]
MNTTYELWDIETGNIVGDFSTADDALKVVQGLLDSYGPDYASDLTLSGRDGTNDARVIASGQQLVDMLERHGWHNSTPVGARTN